MKTLHTVCFTLCAVVAGASYAQAGVLYASTAAGSPGELYIIDQTSGALVQDIGPLQDALGVNYPITGLAFSPTTGVLYGSTGNAGSVDGMLVQINPATAAVTPVGPFNAGPTNANGDPATMADIGFDTAGNLFGVASIGGPNLYSINPATGQATLVGPNGVSTSTSGGGVAIGGGVFYGTPTSSRYGTYDPVTGAFTNITNPAKPAGTGAYTALDFDGSVLYGLNTGPGSSPPTHIVTIDPATGTVTDIGASLNSLDAIAFQNPVPEPATAGLLLLGLLPFIVRRAR